ISASARSAASASAGARALWTRQSLPKRRARSARSASSTAGSWATTKKMGGVMMRGSGVEGGEAVAGAGLHRHRDAADGVPPRGLDLGRAVGPERLAQRLDEDGVEHVVVRRLDAVAAVTAAEDGQPRRYLLEPAQAVDGQAERL